MITLDGTHLMLANLTLTRLALQYIHTWLFQGKSQNFPGFENPPDQNFEPTVQSSIGPTVRSYFKYAHILQTFFNTELSEPNTAV